MADDIDRAQARDEFFRETALQEHFNRGIRNAMAAAATHCEDCGDPISEARRQAVPDCFRCVRCQEEFEIHINWRVL